MSWFTDMFTLMDGEAYGWTGGFPYFLEVPGHCSTLQASSMQRLRLRHKGRAWHSTAF
jgi:hypothetical protein